MVPPDPSSTTLPIREAMPADVPALIALDSVAAHGCGPGCDARHGFLQIP